ncbi:MAG: type II toxin-antitoxin system Phd/YefM family antitoxin [Oscillatoriales cyanobacterium RU_3_3]|nr:type II toxin-antitoxin system Phd/YefM family antitoxin [Oscillatoriales cyanobacterium RU_3_3]NJR25370.1 type II toxin-antitoxin system Phd/YefM family antitoxin [Richelia sp. CSU_2_1]
MIIFARNIHSLADFQRNTIEFVRRLKQTKNPVVLTVNGKAELVVQDVESSQKLLEAVELVETLKGIKQGLTQMKRGEGKKAGDFFDRLLEKLDS